MERLSFPALGLAILLHTVLGISYYFLVVRCSPAPLLGSWLFIACIGDMLHNVNIFPEWGHNCPALLRLIMGTVICCLTLDLTLTMFWCRIESVCHCAIVGILRPLVTDECTFACCEYWLLGVTTSIIGGCLLWLALWATVFSSQLNDTSWQQNLSRSVEQYIYNMVFGPLDLQCANAPRCLESNESFAS